MLTSKEMNQHGCHLAIDPPFRSRSKPETAALRAEVEGLRLALSLAQEALREERGDKEHWRDEAKQLRELLAASKREPEIILAADEIVHDANS